VEVVEERPPVTIMYTKSIVELGHRLAMDREPPAGGSVAVMRLSARNQLEGTVVRVEHGAVMSTVVIRLAGGQEVVSVITKDSAMELDLAEGDAVKAVIKSTEVMIGKD
jgi:molybdopterin-binding protein